MDEARRSIVELIWALRELRAPPIQPSPLCDDDADLANSLCGSWRILLAERGCYRSGWHGWLDWIRIYSGEPLKRLRQQYLRNLYAPAFSAVGPAEYPKH